MARDLIDKDDLISEVDRMIFETGYEKEELMERIESLEVIEERETGEWIPARPLPMEADSYKHKRYWKCSVCGGHDFFNPQYSEKIKFCRYCGAELEVDE